MRFLQIASGSKGNSTFIFDKEIKIILDAGISKKKIDDALNVIGQNLDGLNAILITHEHTDHTQGLVPLYNKTKAKIFITKGTYTNLSSKIKEKIPFEAFCFIKNNEKFVVGDIDIEAFPTFHDATDPVGYIFRSELKKLVYVTDTGYIHDSELKSLNNADAYIFEANHDPEVLMESDRPYETKMRILSDHGHLSNQDSAYYLASIMGPNTKNIVYAHISEECNLVQIIKLTTKKVYDELGVNTDSIRFYYASQSPLEVIEV